MSDRMPITKGTAIRTVVLALALINQLLVSFGYSPLPIGDEEMTETLSTIFTLVAALIAWWKNNSFTQKAILADTTFK